jgi:pyrrolidone-carboxylate peptidase
MRFTNETIKNEVAQALTQYKQEPDYKGFIHINWISELIMKDPDRYPTLSKMKIQGMRNQITKSLKYIVATEIVSGSDSGAGRVLKERS